MFNGTGVAAGDYNQDGKLDLILAGNFYGSRLKFGRLDANRGVMLLGDGNGCFVSVPTHTSGIFLDSEVRDAAQIGSVPLCVSG
jgi:hypothetical protein